MMNYENLDKELARLSSLTDEMNNHSTPFDDRFPYKRLPIERDKPNLKELEGIREFCSSFPSLIGIAFMLISLLSLIILLIIELIPELEVFGGIIGGVLFGLVIFVLQVLGAGYILAADDSSFESVTMQSWGPMLNTYFFVGVIFLVASYFAYKFDSRPKRYSYSIILSIIFMLAVIYGVFNLSIK